MIEIGGSLSLRSNYFLWCAMSLSYFVIYIGNHFAHLSLYSHDYILVQIEIFYLKNFHDKNLL
jgi:hypothetical protein